MIISVLRQKVQGAGKIAKQIFMIVALYANGGEVPVKDASTNASTKH